MPDLGGPALDGELGEVLDAGGGAPGELLVRGNWLVRWQDGLLMADVARKRKLDVSLQLLQ